MSADIMFWQTQPPQPPPEKPLHREGARADRPTVLSCNPGAETAAGPGTITRRSVRQPGRGATLEEVLDE